MHRTSTLLAAALLVVGAAARAAAPDTQAVEFYNQVTGHYFVTASASEALGIDAGAAGPGWLRTGRAFQAWSSAATAPADASPVCRFYSSAANSHFYTASASECAGLQAQAAQEKAATGTVRGWDYEGKAFYIETPSPGGACPAGTTAITRIYNNGFANGEGSNHRFVDDGALEQLMADRQWIPEAVVFCAADKSTTGTDADLPATTSSFGALAGTWTGNASWKVETAASETRVTEALSLTIGSDGAISGTGNGCTFTGQVNVGDGFRSFFQATASASGCSDAAFDGDYPKVRLERFGASMLMVRLQRGDEGNEASIEASLTNPTASPPAPTTPPSFDGVAGDWTGTVAWVAEQHLATGNMIEPTAVNQALSLSIAASGAVTGSGFGCTVTGNLQAANPGEDDDGFGGQLTFAGCDQALFDGTFMQVHVERAGPARIGVNLERTTQDAQGSTRVEVEGTLQSASATGTPPPAPGASASAVGSWQGEAAFFAEQEADDSDATEVSEMQALSLTLASDGTLSGTGFGCTFSGMLSLASGGRSASGTISASGCTKDVFNGDYAGARLQVDDGALEVELERETRASGNETRVRIGGKLASATP